MKTFIHTIIILFACSSFLYSKDKPRSEVIFKIDSEKSTVIVKNNAQLMAEYLRVAVLISGIDNIEVTFTTKFEVEGKNIVISAEYRGERKNGYYRFLQKETGDAITADQDINKAIKSFIEQNGDNLNVNFGVAKPKIIKLPQVNQ